MLTEKDYCDYDTCVALKELGYVGTSRYYYTQRDHKFHFDAYNKFYTVRTADAMGYVLAIHLYEAQKWLREEKNIIVDVRYGEQYYNVVLNHRITGGRHIVMDKNNRIADFTEYEEALLEGIKEAVKLLKEK